MNCTCNKSGFTELPSEQEDIYVFEYWGAQLKRNDGLINLVCRACGAALCADYDATLCRFHAFDAARAEALMEKVK